MLFTGCHFFQISFSSRKHLRVKVTPSMHVEDSKNRIVKMREPGVSIYNDKIRLFLNISIYIVEKYRIFMLFNFLLYKINNLYMKFMNKIGKT